MHSNSAAELVVVGKELEEIGILLTTFEPYCPQSNGLSERMNHKLMETAGTPSEGAIMPWKYLAKHLPFSHTLQLRNVRCRKQHKATGIIDQKGTKKFQNFECLNVQPIFSWTKKYGIQSGLTRPIQGFIWRHFKSSIKYLFWTPRVLCIPKYIL